MTVIDEKRFETQSGASLVSATHPLWDPLPRILLDYGRAPFITDLAWLPVSIYGSVPLMHAHSADSTVAVFHLISSETWIDVSHSSDKSTETHWISESGIMDIFLLPGPTPEEVFSQYARLTGTQSM